MARRGKRPLLELYRRLHGSAVVDGRPFVVDDGAQREIAEYLIDLAHRVEIKGAPEAMTLVSLLAIDAGLHALPRWLQHPRGEANPFLDELDRGVIAAFEPYAKEVRERRPPDALGPHGRVRIDTYLRARGCDDARIEELEKRAYRFLDEARRDGRAPPLFKGLPAFVPIGLHAALEGGAEASASTATKAVAGTAALGAVAAALVLLWPAARADSVSNATARSAFTAELVGGPRVVLGWRGGRWRIVHPDGRVDWEAPRELWLPEEVEGGAAGDVTGDLVPEIALFFGTTLEVFDQHDAGIWVFTPTPTGWRLLDKLPAHPGAPDAAACVALRERLAHTDGITLELHRERQRCPSRISRLEIRDGVLRVAQAHYGRQILRTTCDASGCADLVQDVAVDADVMSTAWLTVPGEPAMLAAGTGCWNRFGGHAYGVLVRRAGDQPSFTWTGGRTSIAPFDATRLAVLVGAPCDGVLQQAAVAASVTGPIDERQRTLAIAEVGADGLLTFGASTRVPACCGEASSIVGLRDPTGPAWIAIATQERDAAAGLRLRIYRAGALDAGPAHDVELWAAERPAELTAIDRDGDGVDELLVTSFDQGTRVLARRGGRWQEVSW